eukprot:411206-Amphidinium_carterae.1
MAHTMCKCKCKLGPDRVVNADEKPASASSQPKATCGVTTERRHRNLHLVTGTVAVTTDADVPAWVQTIYKGCRSEDEEEEEE